MMNNEVDEAVVEKNKKLIEEFPFLKPYNRWTGKTRDDYDYSYTEYDSAEISDAWKEKLLMKMFKEIKKQLIEEEKDMPTDKKKLQDMARWYGQTQYIDKLHLWKITQIKEKFGALRVYSNFESPGIIKIINKYSKLSEKTCYMCGAKATKVSTGYILPYCDKCAEKSMYKCIDIKEWLK